MRISGQAPLGAKVYERETLRCNPCGAVFVADAPPGVGEEKYDAKSASMIALLKTLGRVYKNDAETRKLGLSNEERLRYHQQHSQPLMDALRDWMRDQIEEKRVEPNSALGQAIGYTQKRWKLLTQFLRVPGAPLDNNLAERALKKAILHRKNSLFYKTENGARVGDIFMSLIHTAELARQNTLHYLTQLLENPRDVVANPALWLPWNYRAAADANGRPPDMTAEANSAAP